MTLDKFGNPIPWTVESVKRLLPSVRVHTGKRKFATGRVSGRLNRFATVTVDNCFRHGSNDPWMDFEFSWEAIVHSLNNGTALEV